jgi:UDP-N-acetylglucosamine:LPS N-acetylglucosamine transferase
LGELPSVPSHPLTILFSIGGAGAQKELALAIINNLKDKIKNKELRFIISLGTREYLQSYFTNNVKDLPWDSYLQVLSGKTTKEYFGKFNEALRTTDILMTKPSELSFYAGLGIPIIIQPSIGSQEDFNRRWLEQIGVGVAQENPNYTHEWLYDLLETGNFAEMAMQGFVEIEKMGTYNIEKIINGSIDNK